jgi:hypothetical protein
MTNSKHTLTTFDGLARSVAQLRAENAAVKVDRAILAKLLAPEQRSWAIKYVAENPDGWEKFVGVAQKDQQEQQDKNQSTIFRKMGLTEQQVAVVREKLATKR